MASLVVCLIASVLVAAPRASLAQGAAPITPESEWKLSDIRDEKKSSESYCTLTRGFTKNIVLTIASNQRNETSLAFDFRKDSFASGKTYTVAMNAGPGARRAFEARPVSPRALVITTGQDEAFYAGIRKSGKLDVSISGDIYSFAIDGLGTAMDRLSACVGELRQAAADSPPAPLAASASRKGAQSGAPKSELAALQEENRRLSETLEQERRSYENSAMGAAGSNALTELREKIVLLEKENTRLRAQDGVAEPTPAKASAGPGAPAQTGSKQAEDISTLRAENARLRKALAEEKSARIDVPEAVSPKAFETLRQQYEEKKAENDRLKKDLEAARLASSDAAVPSAETITQTRILEEKLASAEKRVEVLAQESSQLRTEKEKLLLKKSDNNWDAEEATRRYNEADREARRLSLLLDEKTSTCNAEKTKLEGLLFDPAVTSNAQIAHLADLEEQLQKAHADLGASDSICEGKIAQAEKQAGGKAVESLKDQIARMEKERDSLKTSVKESEDALARATSTRQEAEGQKIAYEKKIADLEASLKKSTQALSAALADRESTLKTAQSDAERKVREQDAAIALLQKEKTDLTADLADVRKTLDGAASTRQEAEGQKIAYEKKIADLEASLKKGTQALSAALADRESALKTAQSDAERKVREQDAAIALLQKEKTDLAARLARVETDRMAENAASKVASVEGERERGASEDLRADMGRKETAFRETVSRLEAEKIALARQVQALQSRSTPVVASPASLAPKESLVKREDSASKSSQELEALRAEIARRDLASRQQADSAKVELDKKIAVLESEKKALQFALSQIGSAGGTPNPVAQETRPAARVSLPPDRAAIPASFPGQSTQARLPVPLPRATPFMSVSNVTALLNSANLSVSSRVESVTPAMETTARAFRWESGPLFGSLEERQMTAPEQFTDFVSDYLDRTRSHCAGDFASSATSVPPPQGIEQANAQEIACVSPAGGSSAAVLFVARNGVFSVIANETSAESIDTAIEARDRIYTALSSLGRNGSQ